MFCVAISLILTVDQEGFDPQGQFKFFGNNWRDYIEALGNFNTCFFVHPFISPIMAEMEHPTLARCTGVVLATNVVSAILNFVTGLLSRLHFRSVPSYDPIFAYLDTNRPDIVVGIVAMYISSLCLTAYYTYYLATTIASLILKDAGNQMIPVVMSGVVVILSYCALNFTDTIVTDIAVFIGNVAFLLLAFVLPPIFYLVQFRFSNLRWSILAIVVMVVGVGVGMVILYYNFESFAKN
jgi:hypothetical protein